jgi:surfactin synthase thioesterase subunit
MKPAASDATLWLRCFHRAAGERPRVACFPHAGGSASTYFSLSRALRPAVEVIAVQYPGRQDRADEPCIDTIEQLADLATAALRAAGPLPDALFGHSMGAVIAFEVARRLEKDGGRAPTLFVSGRRAPARLRNENIHLRDDQGVVDALVRLGGTNPEVLRDETLLNLIIPALRSDYRAIETYRYSPGPPLSCPVIVLAGTDDPQVTPAEAVDWNRYTTGDFALAFFDGGHFYLNDQIGAVARDIADRLAPTGSPRRDTTSERLHA